MFLLVILVLILRPLLHFSLLRSNSTFDFFDILSVILNSILFILIITFLYNLLGFGSPLVHFILLYFGSLHNRFSLFANRFVSFLLFVKHFHDLFLLLQGQLLHVLLHLVQFLHLLLLLLDHGALLEGVERRGHIVRRWLRHCLDHVRLSPRVVLRGGDSPPVAVHEERDLPGGGRVVMPHVQLVEALRGGLLRLAEGL